MADYVTAVRTSDGDKKISATKLENSRTFRTNLASTSTASFNGTANVTPGVTGTLPVANGGTGKSSFTANRLIYPSAGTTLSQLAFPSVDGSVLTQNKSGAPYWTSIADLGTTLGLSNLGREWIYLTKIENGSGSYTAPDLYGGAKYDLGVYMIGGGGSGAVGVTAYSFDEEEDKEDVGFYLSGGASGYGRNVIFESVIPGTKYTYVIGEGGAAATLSYEWEGSKYSTKWHSAVAGNNGATTTFNGYVVHGGEGGRYLSTLSNNTKHTALISYGGQDNLAETVSGTIRNYYGGSNNQRAQQNQFESTMVTLACGMGAKAVCKYDSTGAFTMSGTTSTPLSTSKPTHGIVGNAEYSSFSTGTVNVSNATTPTCGNGGGATAVSTKKLSATVTGAPGGRGIIFIYARRVG